MKRKLLYALLFIAMVLLLSGGVMLLWNALLPGIVHAPVINYWQALGLIVLFRILFGGPAFWWMPGRRYREPAGELKDKLMGMDENDRAAFKEEWRKRCAGKGDQ